MLFGQCPHRGGDKLKGASLTAMMISDENGNDDDDDDDVDEDKEGEHSSDI